MMVPGSASMMTGGGSIGPTTRAGCKDGRIWGGFGDAAGSGRVLRGGGGGACVSHCCFMRLVASDLCIVIPTREIVRGRSFGPVLSSLAASRIAIEAVTVVRAIAVRASLPMRKSRAQMASIFAGSCSSPSSSEISLRISFSIAVARLSDGFLYLRADRCCFPVTVGVIILLVPTAVSSYVRFPHTSLFSVSSGASFKSLTCTPLYHLPPGPLSSTITGEMIRRTSSGPTNFGASFALNASFLLDSGCSHFQTRSPVASSAGANYNISLVVGTTAPNLSGRAHMPR